MESILHAIDTEEWRAGHKLPSENEMIDLYGVGRNTIREALLKLESNGIIYRRQGKGTFYSGKRFPSENRTFLIGVVMPQHYFFSEVIQGIDEESTKHRYHILLSNNRRGSVSDETYIREIVGKGVDGLLYLPVGTPGEEEIFSWIEPLDIPVVILSWKLNRNNFSFVTLDDRHGGYMATAHLLKTGHRRIAFVGLGGHVPSKDRYQGYRQALEEHGLSTDPSIETWIPTAEPGRFSEEAESLTRKLLVDAGPGGLDSVFFMSDSAALAGYRAIKGMGLSIPEDISVVGFDDSELASHAAPPLTTVLYPKFELGKLAAAALFDQIEEGANSLARQVVLQPRIRIRESVSERKP